MSNKSKGADFERRVKKELELRGWYVIRNRQPSFKFKSVAQFPDLVALPEKGEEPMFIECKWNKYLKPEEQEKFKNLEQYGKVFVCWREKIKNKIYCVFGNPYDYREIFRIK